MRVLIVPLKKEDIPAVIKIEKESFSNPLIRTQFNECLNNENVKVFVAKADAEIAGYIVFEFVLDEGHIPSLAVKEKFRKQGMGKKLFEYAFIEAKKRGIKLILLEVGESNDIAKKFYLGFGFEESGCRKGYYKNPVEDALILSLKMG